jgi:predicted dehydrogenase
MSSPVDRRAGHFSRSHRMRSLGAESHPCVFVVAWVDVTAVADPDLRRLESVRQSHPAVRSLTDYRELLGQDSLDAIVVATPTRRITRSPGKR